MSDLTELARRIADTVKAHVERALEPIHRRFAQIEERFATERRQTTHDVEAALSIASDGLLRRTTQLIADLPPARDGKDGKDFDPQRLEEAVDNALARMRLEATESLRAELLRSVQAFVKSEMSALPVPKDGKDGADVDWSRVETKLIELVAGIPQPVNGKDGKDGQDADWPRVEAKLIELVGGIPTPTNGKDGKDGIDGKNGEDADWPRVEAKLVELVGGIPVPINGKDGKDGVDGKDGQDADWPRVESRLQELVSSLPKAVDGKDGKDGKDAVVDWSSLELRARTILEALVSAIPKPKDGRDGKDGRDAKEVDYAQVIKFVDEAIARVPKARDGVDGKDGKDGANGKDGKDAAWDQKAVEEYIAALLAALPKPQDGKDGVDGKDGASVDWSAVDTRLLELVTALPKAVDGVNGKDGKDGVDGKDGASVDWSAVDARIVELVAALPKAVDGVNGKDGKDGVDGKDGPSREEVDTMVREAAEHWLQALPVPKDGKDGVDGKDVPWDQVDARIVELVSSLPKPVDGVDGKDGQDVDQAAVDAWLEKKGDTLLALITERLAAIKDGKDGVDGKDAVIDWEAIEARMRSMVPKDGANGRSAYEIAVSHGFAGTEEQWLASLVGIGIQGEQGPTGKGLPGPAGRDGRDGRDAADPELIRRMAAEETHKLWTGVTAELVPAGNGRDFVFRAKINGNPICESVLHVDTLLYRGVFSSETDYEKGDCVTDDGSTWHCKVPHTRARPGTSKDWQLMVKKGRDGMNYDDPRRPTPGPVNLK